MALLSLTPLLLLGFLCLYARLRGCDVYQALLDGADKGLRLTLELMPALVLLFALIHTLRASGLGEYLVDLAAPLLRRLGEIRHRFFSGDDAFWGAADDEKRIAALRRGNCAGVFSLDSRSGRVPLDAPDGIYEELIAGGTVEVKDGTVFCPGRPLIFRLG